MRAFAIVGWMLVSACGGMFARVHDPDSFAGEARRAIYVGEPLRTWLFWDCGAVPAGAPPDACQRFVQLAPPPCDGVPCTTTVTAAEQLSHDHGRVAIDITPLAPGSLHARLDARLADGGVRLIDLTADVVPAPTLVLACQIRDATSGAFSPCPTIIPPGAEVHVTATATGIVSPLSLQIDPSNRQHDLEYRYAHCHRLPSELPGTAIERCSDTLPPGHHAFVARIGRLPEMRLELDVADPRS